MSPFRTRLITILVISLSSTLLAQSPREKLLLDPNWHFIQGDPQGTSDTFKFLQNEGDLMKQSVESEMRDQKARSTLPDVVKENIGGNLSYVQPTYNDQSWRRLNLPHDYALEQPFDEKGNKNKGYRHLEWADGSGIGWYRKTFALPQSDSSKILTVQFDGAYRQSMVWFNGHCLGRTASGYSSFTYDLTPYAHCGGANTLVIRTDAVHDEGWFYEGAGIYRHVWLIKTQPLHVAQWGTYVTSELQANQAIVKVETTVVNQNSLPANAELFSQLLDPTGHEVATSTTPLRLEAKTNKILSQNLSVKNPQLWSPETPHLYQLVSQIRSNGNVVDIYDTTCGIRSVAFDPIKGFLLNGKQRLIKGVCNHQDFAGVGTAVPDRLQEYRVRIMREMGCDGWRMAHNPPSPELLDECDRQGMMVMDETRRFGKYPEPLSDLTTMLLRDRNHPSIVIWSLGNEEMSIQCKEVGAETLKVTQQLAHQLDPTRLCTIAQNHADDKVGFVPVIDVTGMNYLKLWGNMDRYHQEHPQWRFIGSEEASTLTTRGEYFDDFTKSYKAAYDTGSSTAGWGATAETWWKHYLARPWACGAFAWTGFDYRGEPTPYQWPNISSHFGIVDTCGFPKDTYYYYQSWWTDKPTLHLFPHWNWNKKPHRTIHLTVTGSSEKAEVLLNTFNGGKQKISPSGTTWGTILFVPGTLTVKTYTANNLIASKSFEINESSQISSDLNPVTASVSLPSKPLSPNPTQPDATQPDQGQTTAKPSSTVLIPDHVSISVVEEPIRVWAQTNCDEVELFVNGQSQGRVRTEPNSHAEWKPIPYVPGSIEAKGYRQGVLVLSDKIQTTQDSCAIAMTANRSELLGDGEDLALIKVSALDSGNLFVPTADNEIAFTVQGPGKILGVGNGDPSCHQSDIEPHRALFNGLAMVLVQSTGGSGKIVLTASSPGLKPSSLTIPVTESRLRARVE